MLAINNLTIQYSDKYLFRDVSVRAGEQEKIGLVGVNGAGKSTLLKILAGLVETDAGVVQRSRHATCGYLPQEITEFPTQRTLFQEAADAFADLFAKHEELETINRRLAAADPTSPAFADLLAQQGELQGILDQADFFSLEGRIEKVLIGLGFNRNDFDRPCSTFSGGWLMRLMLAKLLLQRPAYLLLDEPTNHLDIESLTWLESFLVEYPGSIILISHDRSFLDAVTTTTWELSLGRLTVYRGNYSWYVKEKEQRLRVQRAAYENQQAQIQQTMRFVQRFRAKSTKAKQVQSRLRQLAKMERIEIEETERSVHFRFPPAPPSGRDVLRIEHLAKGFDDKPVLTDVNLELQRGDKLAVVGVNGAGKSTLVKLIAGLLAPDHGTIRFGHNVRLSYFGQHQAQELPTDRTVLETLAMVEGDRTTTEDRNLLAAFLFSGDAVDKKVHVLSGGEKSRLALARMIAAPANLLVMDEPTNHLDMASQEILQEALAQYDGTIVVVSHNRHFLDSFVNKVLVIHDGIAELHHGTLSEYLERRRQQEEASPPPKAAQRQPGPSRKEQRRLAAQRRQERNRRLAPLRAAVAEAEKQIAALEERKSELEQILADPDTYNDQERFAELSREYNTVERRLDRWLSKWEERQARLEKEEKVLSAECKGLLT